MCGFCTSATWTTRNSPLPTYSIRCTVSNHTAIRNLDNLEKWFQQVKPTRWNLYRGHQNKCLGQFQIIKLDEDVDLDTSWRILSEQLEIYSPGQFSIFVPGNNSHQQYMIHVSLGMDGVSGISGYGRGNAYALGMIPEDEVQRRVQEAVRMERLERMIEDLQAERQYTTPLTERLAEKLMELDVNSIVPVLQGIFSPRSYSSGLPYPQNVSGVPGVPVAAHREGGESDSDEGAGTFVYDDQKIIYGLDALRSQLENPDDPQVFYRFWDQLITLFMNNPQAVITLVKHTENGPQQQ